MEPRTTQPQPDPNRDRGQKGALMAGVVAMIAVSLVWSAIAFQAWIDVLRRDNEAEMIFRAQEIVRAIQRYRRDHGGQGPPTLKELLKPSPRRSYYIRRSYDDPLVPDGKWGLLYVGPGGSIIDPNAEPELGALGLGGGLPGQPDNAGQLLAGEDTDRPGLLGGIGNPDGGDEEQGIGLPIAGVRTLCEDKPFRVYKEETDYSKWLFTFLDLEGGGGRPGRKGKGKGGIGTPTPLENQGNNRGGAQGNQRVP